MVDKKITRAQEDGPVTVADLPYINAIVLKGDRVELIPVKDGVKVVRVRREEVKNEKKIH